ncbi:MAG: ParB/RepB/Spo0J family partition protein [Acidimicrobiia bacterium]|nr:ParB/RepB/Spo0J family partition protein [Acidimicrobiia bacterium]
MSGYQYLPPLDEAETEALRSSIETFGVLHPVTTDEAGTILDGHHRARIAGELGIDYPTTVLPGLTHEQKIETALTLNLGRRHLSVEERRALVARLREEGLSVRWISERTGIPRSTVQRDAESGVPGGTPDYVSGRDGKRYRARWSHEPAAVWQRAWSAALGWQVPASGREAWDWMRSGPDVMGEMLDSFEAEFAGDEATWEAALDAALEAMCRQWAAQHLYRTGVVLPAPPQLRHVWSVRWATEVWAVVWARLVEIEVGTFLNWCDEHVAGKDPYDLAPEILGKWATWAGVTG